MLNQFGIFAILVGFLAFAVGASLVGGEEEMNEEMNGGIRVPPVGMVLIPAGTFQMGSEGWDHDEQPVHIVHLDAFYMDKYEVTNAQFKVFVDANPHWQKDNISLWENQDVWFQDGDYLDDWNGHTYPSGKANHPVDYVSWYAAMAYAEWAGKRLPIEAEWEYAARGGLERQKYPWGNTITDTDANYGWDLGAATKPVGEYAANGYGLYDMAGNVWEWCLDEYDAEFYTFYTKTHPHRHYSQNPISSTVTLQGLLDSFASVRPFSFRVLRGGSWQDLGYRLRVANRSRETPPSTDDSLGFRCVRAVTP